ncbi:Cu(I)-responsive transcriptional regulator [Sneathiella sp. P13V-1]|uniref:Cu(I)-responsive transcriptional regulator n=1 Tax=Sneathiella sp. P13V-1 TaxID=2697366 RepID=UPI00187B3791|nr:Cu(I)-responsive transcriptional regulator [Sneathiella sp. P13V-1]MBE7636731.1 Cu(I)-responsive transcriptional regulator [Sneathiella sp. P13V-1]
MNIGTAATKSGLTAKTIRYYEDIGLVTPARSENGYRDYSEEHVHYLNFIQRSRSLGFSIDECRALLSLYNDRARSSSEVKKLALHKIEDIEHKIAGLTSMKNMLIDLAGKCHGDDRPDCPILDNIAGDHKVGK